MTAKKNKNNLYTYVEPQKPYKPIKPEEILKDQKIKIQIIESIKLNDLLNKIPQHIKQEDVFIEIENYYESSEAYLCYINDVENTNFKQQLKYYEKDMVKYEKNMKQYLIELEKFKEGYKLLAEKQFQDLEKKYKQELKKRQNQVG